MPIASLKKGKKLTYCKSLRNVNINFKGSFSFHCRAAVLKLDSRKKPVHFLYNSYIIHMYHFWERLKQTWIPAFTLLGFPPNSVSLFMWLKSLFQYIRFRPSENHYNPQTQGDWSSLRDLPVTWHQGKRRTAERAIKQDGLFNLLTINKIHNSSGGRWRCVTPSVRPFLTEEMSVNSLWKGCGWIHAPSFARQTQLLHVKGWQECDKSQPSLKSASVNFIKESLGHYNKNETRSLCRRQTGAQMYSFVSKKRSFVSFHSYSDLN